MRNFGFSGATDLFVFVGGYTAAILYGKMMLERGFVVTATRIFKRLWQLYAAYIVLFVIYINLIGYVARKVRRARDHRRIQCHRNRRPYGPDADPRPAASGQAAQSRCAATLHRPDGILSARPVRHGTPAELSRWPASIGLYLAARSIRLEPVRRFRMDTGTSIRSAGNCCSCWAPGLPWAAQDKCAPCAPCRIPRSCALWRCSTCCSRWR